MWLLPISIAKSFAASLTIRMTPINNDNAQHLLRREIEGQECIYTYIEAVNYLLNSFAADDMIAKAAAEI